MPNQHNYHKSAAGLIVAAAEKSGLLRNVAEALYWHDGFKSGEGPVQCLACGMLEELAEEFENLSGRCVGYDFYGEGFCIPPATDAEVASYLGTA
jgi:hypothetical protein